MKRALALPLVALSTAGCSLFRPYPRDLSLPRYEVRLVDEADDPIRTMVRDGKRVYLGVIGQRYALEITNATDREVGCFVTVDGLDTSEIRALPPTSLARSGSIVGAHEKTEIPGFVVSRERLAPFRFAPAGHSYAEHLGLAPTEAAVGTIRITFATLKAATPSPPASRPREQSGFDDGARGPRNLPTRLPDEAPPPVETALIEIPPREFVDRMFDRILETITISYEDATTHQPLGTAPPPGIVVHSRPAPGPDESEELPRPPVRGPTAPADAEPEKSRPPKARDFPRGKGPGRGK